MINLCLAWEMRVLSVTLWEGFLVASRYNVVGALLTGNETLNLNAVCCLDHVSEYGCCNWKSV